MNKPLEGKVALVTGASRGIGKAIAEELAVQGASVALAARNAGPAEAIAAGIQDSGGSTQVLAMDVSDPASVDAAVKEISDKLGPVGILVNNAGVTRDQLLMRMKPEDWSSVLDTNLSGAFNCIKAVTRDMMKARWGRIINISSVVGTIGNAGQANYAASKAGLHGLTRSVAKELGSRSINVNAVAPGFIETAMTEELPDKTRQSMLDSIPLGRFGHTREVAQVVGFLAGPGGDYITGQVIHIDGGMVMA